MNITVVGIYANGITQDLPVVLMFGSDISETLVLTFFNAYHANFLLGFTPVDNQEILVFIFKPFQKFPNTKIIEFCRFLPGACAVAFTDTLVKTGPCRIV
jgi:hypothetical protein